MTRQIARLAALSVLMTVFHLQGIPANSSEVAASQTAPKFGGIFFSTKPIDVGNGYQMRLSNTGAKVLRVEIKKSDAEATSTQTYTWSFTDMPAGWLKASNREMARVTVAAGSALGSHGTFDMISNKVVAEIKALPGCTGKHQVRRGNLAGNFSFDTKTDLFGTIEVEKFFLAKLQRSVNGSTCPPPPYDYCVSYDRLILGTADLSFGDRFAGYYFSMFKTGPAAPVIYAMLEEKSPGVEFRRELYQTVPEENFVFSQGAVQVTGAGAVTGVLDYEATHVEPAKEDVDCPAKDWTLTFGELSGNLTYNFDLEPFDLAENGFTSAQTWRLAPPGQ